MAQASSFAGNSAPFGASRVLTQVAHDLFGTKDVQDAITATYVWMADQIGHLTLGFVPTVLLCWIASLIWADWAFANSEWRFLVYLVLAGAVFGYWVSKELTDLADSEARATDIFPLDSGDILWNVKTALLYFAVGGVLGLAAFVHWYLVPVALAIAIWPALAVAFWWLRRKLAFQQAGLPYLFRLANFASKLDGDLLTTIEDMVNLKKDQKTNFWAVLIGNDPVPHHEPKIRHLLISGPLDAGKTSLCVGMGTEFAFSLGRGRYLSATKLAQLLVGGEGTTDGDLTEEDGLVLWNWKTCDLLIVDDVDAGARPPGDKTDRSATHLIEPDVFAGAMIQAGGPTPLAEFASRRTVWVLGDGDATSWRNTIAALMGIPTEALARVELRGTIAPAAAPAPIRPTPLRAMLAAQPGAEKQKRQKPALTATGGFIK
ncbi:MAG TPA: hypothetical protein VID77_03550 [Stellaceae bacterium]|jgi:hypothetical protein